MHHKIQMYVPVVVSLITTHNYTQLTVGLLIFSACAMKKYIRLVFHCSIEAVYYVEATF